MLQFTGLQRIRQHLATEQQQYTNNDTVDPYIYILHPVVQAAALKMLPEESKQKMTYT